MWEKLLELGQPMNMPWLILGDFNCVKSPTEKQLGATPTWYELKHFTDCCLSLGLNDAPTTGCYFTWYSNSESNPVWCKLDRVLFNNKWLEAGLLCNAHFSPPGCLSDHSPVRELRKKAVFLAEAERHFYYQKAKLHFLKMEDRNTKFFHDMERSSTEAAQPQYHCPRPKSDHCPTVADYRPFSCCNVIYKAITKIIADRLATALDHPIDRCQAAIVGGRSITDNIFLAHRKWSDSTRGNGFHLAVQLMLTCARHSTRYRGPSFHRSCTGMAFPLSLLHGLWNVFPPHHFQWHSMAHSWVFRGKEGLRQGDPMSPGLFLLCMEYFSRLIKRKTTDSDFNFHPKCEKLKITHLLFADDLMMFSRGDLPSVHILMECLQEFRDVSGLAVNTSKSSIFTAGIENNILCDILARTEFTRGEMPVREWSVFGYKSSHSQRQSLRKSTGFVGIFSGTPNEHRLLGRISVIPKMKGVLASGIHKLGTWPSLPEFYGTSTARQTRFGYSGSMLSISKEDQFGIGNRRRRLTTPSTACRNPHKSLRFWLARGGNRAHGRVEQQLSTRDRLMFLQEDSSCSLCINTQETAKHLFFECPFSNLVWTNIRQWLGIHRRMSTLLSAVKWLIKEKTRSSVQNKARLIALACTVYSLWRHRNEVIFEGKTPCPEGLVISIRITVYRILLTLFPHGLIILNPQSGIVTLRVCPEYFVHILG
ncbi:UNVERIFIED_CONTAM: hypothetical protein Sangu_3261800 [Sesamum angustifolium]|uniref:Reverse transcriptase domain-containing protein n=1 Tax=Sesamum angustifolium TaxID=2727405 RepID=A0AAW2JDR6_9LAMI